MFGRQVYQLPGLFAYGKIKWIVAFTMCLCCHLFKWSPMWLRILENACSSYAYICVFQPNTSSKLMGNQACLRVSLRGFVLGPLAPLSTVKSCRYDMHTRFFRGLFLVDLFDKKVSAKNGNRKDFCYHTEYAENVLTVWKIPQNFLDCCM